MFTPSKMHLVRAVLPRDGVDSALFRLLLESDVQFVDFDLTVPGVSGLEQPPGFPGVNELRMVEEKTFALRDVLGISGTACPVTDDVFLGSAGVPEAVRKTGEFCKIYSSLEAELENLGRKKSALVGLKTRIAGNPELAGFTAPGPGSRLFTLLGTLGRKNLESLRGALAAYPVVFYPFSSGRRRWTVLLAGLDRDRSVIKTILDGTDWRAMDAEKSGISEADLSRDLDAEIGEIGRSEAECRRKIAEYVGGNRDLAVEGFWKARILRIIDESKTSFRFTRAGVLIAFWTPSAGMDRVVGLLRSASSDRCYIEGLPAGRVPRFLSGKLRIPVLFENPAFFRPFEPLVRNFGLPAYGTIDPTPVFALTFILMFGFMFADLGQGLTLSLAGLLAGLARRSPLKRFASVLVFAGLSSAVFGCLFGSFFGFSSVIRPLWLDPMDRIGLIIPLAIGYGILMITLGLFFNFYNSIRTRDIRGGVFDRFGLLGGVLYWSALGFAVYGLVLGHRIAPAAVLLLVGVPALLLFFRGPILAGLKLAPALPEERGPMMFLTSAVETLGLATVYLSNTISFVRIAAFTLSHIGLFAAVFAVADIAGSVPPAGVWSWAVIVLGNIGIIALEGLIAGIQSVRLEYYEFFTKFFREGELEFKPVRLTVPV